MFSKPQKTRRISQQLHGSKRRIRSRGRARRLLLESLEDRRVFSVDWRNPVDSIDVNSDGNVSPIDALLVINYLNSGDSRSLPPEHDPSKSYVDVSGDQTASPLDALLVINQLNAKRGTRSLSEIAGQFSQESSVTITLGQLTGTREYRVRIDSQFDTTDQASASEDLLAVYLVDPKNPTTTLLDRGENGTALFTLAGTDAEFVPGRVRWDGSVLEINLSDLATIDTGLLKFQLLSHDEYRDTSVSIFPLTNQVDTAGTISSPLELNNAPLVVGPAISLANLTQPDNVEVHVSNVRFNASTGKYGAELQVRNEGDSLGRDIAVVFAGLPTTVTLLNASGTTAAGEPYVNLKPAIARGGLTQGTWSEPVAIEFNNPSKVPFAIKPQVLAASNRAPTLPAISALTVMPGAVLNVPLAGQDPDGDPIAYSLVTTGGTSSLPTGSVQPTGMLTFRPTPTQLGTYQFDVIASDGALETRQPVTLNVVADPVTTTRVSGKVLKVNGEPLSNVPVQIGAVQGLTLADGSFTLDLGSGTVVSDTLKVRGELLNGSAMYPFIAEKLSFILEHDVYSRVNNVIDRPIYLPEIDIANGKTIDPTQNTTVTSAALPGAQVIVAASTLMNQQGTPFTGLLSMTEVRVDLTPAALPEGLRADLVVTIQPGEMVFTTPTPLSLPNAGGYAPGTLMDLWSINPTTGQFDKVGVGKVNESGTVIDTISGGIRNSSWHFFDPPAPTGPKIKNDPRNKKPSVCGASAEATSSCELHSGALIETHELVTYQSQGIERGLTLTYDSLRADPRPIVHFTFDELNPNQYSVPSAVRLIAELEVSRNDFSTEVPGFIGGAHGLNGNENIWRLPMEAGTVDAALQVNLRDQPTGVYDYTLRSGMLGYAGARGFIGTLNETTSQFTSVNTRRSALGAGWGISGLLELVENRDGSILVVNGDGSELLYPQNANGNYDHPPGEFAVLSKLAEGTFRRVWPDQTIEQFNANNKLASVTDRNGNISRYQYDGVGRLTKFIDPVGLETTLTYSQSQVEITDPAARVTRLNLDANGNLTRVTDPDGSSRRWRYDNLNHMTGETDQLGNVESANYGFHGRVTNVVRKDGTVREYSPIDVQGLFPPEQIAADPIATPQLNPLATRVPLAESTFVDVNGNVTRSKLDDRGQIVSATDNLGSLSQVIRNSDNLPVEVIDANGNSTSFTYDNRGNVLTQSKDLGSIERPFGTALQFDGINDGLFIPDSPSLRSNNVTLESWIKFDSVPQVASILAKPLPVLIPNAINGTKYYIPSYRIWYENGQLLTWVSNGLNGQSSYSTIAAPWKPETGRWHHVGMTFDDTTDTLTMFVDGVPVAVGIVVLSIVYDDHPLIIGADLEDTQPARWFPGAIDEVRVWNVARTPDQIRSGMFRLPSETDVGLVASYSFDQSSDAAILDSSPNQNHGTLPSDGPAYIESGIRNLRPIQAPEGLVAWWSADGHANDLITGNNGASNLGSSYAPSVVGLGFRLDGQDDFVRVADAVDGSLDTTGDMTINAWINPTLIAGKQRTIIQKRPAVGNNDLAYSLFLETDGRLAFTSRQNGSGFRTVLSNTTIPINKWSHVAVTIKGSTLQFYVNGVSDASLSYLFSRPATDGPMTIGSTVVDGASLHNFQGSIDEVQLFGRALTSQEIRAIAGADRAGQRKPTMYDAALDFSTASNPNGVWEYGASTTLGAPFSRTMTKSPDDYHVIGFSHQSRVVRTENRISQGVHVIFISGYQAPGFTSSPDGVTLTAGGFDQASVLQWTAPQTGTYRINGRFEGLGVPWWAEPERRSKVNVLLNNNAATPLLSGTTLGNGSQVPFSILQFVQAGERLQFTVVNPPGTSDIVGVSATILLEDSASSGNAGSGSANLATQTSTYEPNFNQLTSVTDEIGRKTLLTVDTANGNTIASTRVVGAVGGDDDITNLYTYTPSGQIETVTDPLGRITKSTYDSFGRLTQIRRAFGTPLQTLQEFTYDAAGRITTSTDENGHRTQFTHDAMNRVTSTTLPDGSISRSTYDARGNIVRTTDPLGYTQSQTIDSLDRVTKQTDSTGNVTKFQFDRAGNLTSVTDPLNHVTRSVYDARRRVTSTQDAIGNATRYKYDAKNQLLSLQDANGNKTSFVYDTRGNVTQTTDPLGLTSTYTYDTAGQLKKQVERSGRTKQFAYNDLGQLATETWLEEDNSQSNIIHYSYDALGFLAEANDNFSSVVFTRDKLNRTEQIRTAGPNGVPTSLLNYTFDAVGNILTQTDTINSVVGATTTSAFDSLNRVTQLVQTGAGIAAKRVNIAYNALGQTTSLARFADSDGQLPVAVSSFAYDTLNRLTSLSHLNAADATLNSFSYQYDSASRIAQIADIDGAANFVYNNRDELTTVTNADPTNTDESYSYDATGNRTNSHLHGRNYVTGSGAASSSANRLTSDGKFNYVYDADGNLTNRTEISSGNVREFLYDHRNRLVQVIDRPSASGLATQVVKYTYDLSNRRIATNVDATPADANDGEVTYFVYSGENVVAEVRDVDGSGPNSGAVSMRYLQGPAVDQVLAQESASGDVHWLLADHLGTIRDLIGVDGSVLNHIKYDSYGNVIDESNAAISTRYRYTGREFDAETGLQYNRARYYDSAVGRFISEDPIGFAGGDANVYRYVANSPVANTDPFGLEGSPASDAAKPWFIAWIQKYVDKYGFGAVDFDPVPDPPAPPPQPQRKLSGPELIREIDRELEKFDDLPDLIKQANDLLDEINRREGRKRAPKPKKDC